MRRLWRVRWQTDEIEERALRLLRPSRMSIPYTWPLIPDECPCDIHFCDYLETRAIRRRSIFHFGTGLHHVVGLRNRDATWENEILAITASPREHASYVRKAVGDAALGRHYKVLFADIYNLGATSLASFDVVTLFHLCEFTPRGTPETRLDDAGVLDLLLSKLTESGCVIFYEGSYGFERTASLIEKAVAHGRISFAERYESLLVYRAGPGR